MTTTDETETVATEETEETVVSAIEPQVDDLTEEDAVVKLTIESAVPVEKGEQSASAIEEETPEPNAEEPQVVSDTGSSSLTSDGVEVVEEEAIEVEIEADAKQAEVNFDEQAVQKTETSQDIAATEFEQEDTVVEQEMDESTSVSAAPTGSSSLASDMPAIVASLAAGACVAAGAVAVTKLNTTTESVETDEEDVNANQETLDDADVPENTDVQVEVEEDVVFSKIVTSEPIVKALPVAEVVSEPEVIEETEDSVEETELDNNLEAVEEETTNTLKTSEAPVVDEKDSPSAVKEELKDTVSSGIISDTPQIIASLALGACAVSATAVAVASTTGVEEPVDEASLVTKDVVLTNEEEEVIDDMIDATVEEVLSIASSDEQRDSLTDEAVDDFHDESEPVEDTVSAEDVESLSATPIEDTAEVDKQKTEKPVSTSMADELVDDEFAVEPETEEIEAEVVEEEAPEDAVQETITEVVNKEVEGEPEAIPEPSTETIPIESECEVKTMGSADEKSEQVTAEETVSEVCVAGMATEPKSPEIVDDVEIVKEEVVASTVETTEDLVVVEKDSAVDNLKQTEVVEVQPVSSDSTSEMPQIVASLALGACAVTAVAVANEINSFDEVESPTVERVVVADAGVKAVDEMAVGQTELVDGVVKTSDVEEIQVGANESTIDPEAELVVEGATVEESVAVEPIVEFEESVAEDLDTPVASATNEEADLEVVVVEEDALEMEKADGEVSITEDSQDKEVNTEAVKTEGKSEAVVAIREGDDATKTLEAVEAASDAMEELVAVESVAVAPEADEVIEEAEPLKSEENVGASQREEIIIDPAAVVNEEVDTDEADTIDDVVMVEEVTKEKTPVEDATEIGAENAVLTSEVVATEKELAAGADAIEIDEPAVDSAAEEPVDQVEGPVRQAVEPLTVADEAALESAVDESATEKVVAVEQVSTYGEIAIKDGEVPVGEPVAKVKDEDEPAKEKEPEQEEVSKAPSSGGWFKNLLFRKKPTAMAVECVQQSAVKAKEDVADHAAETDTQIHATLSDVEVADEPVLDDLVSGVEEGSAAIPQDTPLEEEQSLSAEMESAAVEIEHQKVATGAIPEPQLKAEDVQEPSDTDRLAVNDKEEVQVVENEPESEHEAVATEIDVIEKDGAVAEADDATKKEESESAEVVAFDGAGVAEVEAVDAEVAANTKVEAVEVEDATTEPAQVEAVETETQEVEAEEIADPAVDNVPDAEAIKEEAEVVAAIEEATVEEFVEGDVAVEETIETEPIVDTSIEEATVAVDDTDDKEPAVEVADEPAEEPTNIAEDVVEDVTESSVEEDVSAATDADVVEEHTVVEEVVMEADAVEPVVAEPESGEPGSGKDTESVEAVETAVVDPEPVENVAVEAKSDEDAEDVAMETVSTSGEVVEEIPVETVDSSVEEVAAAAKDDLAEVTHAEIIEGESVTTPTESVSATLAATTSNEATAETVDEYEAVVDEIAMDAVEEANSSDDDAAEDVAKPDNNTDDVEEVASQHEKADRGDKGATTEANEAATTPTETETVTVDDDDVPAVEEVAITEEEAVTTSTEPLETAVAAVEEVEKTPTAELQAAEVETVKTVETVEEVTEDSSVVEPMETEDVTVVEEKPEPVEPTPASVSAVVKERPIEVAVASPSVNEENAKPVETFKVDTKPISAVAMLIGRFEKIAKKNAEEAASSRTSSRVSSRVSSPLPSPPTSFSRGNVFETAARNIEAVEKGEQLVEEKVHVEAIEEESNAEETEDETKTEETATEVAIAVEETTTEAEAVVEEVVPEVVETESKLPDSEVVEATEEKDKIEVPATETVTDETAAVEEAEAEENTEVADTETEREAVEAEQDDVEHEAAEEVPAVKVVTAELEECRPELETDVGEKQSEVSENSVEVEAAPASLDTVEEESADANVVDEVVEAAVETSRETQTITTAYEAAESSILSVDTPEDNVDVNAPAPAATAEVEVTKEIPVEPEVATADFTTNETVEAYEPLKKETVPTELPVTDNQIEEDPSDLVSATKKTPIVHEESKESAEPEKTGRRMSSISPEAPAVQTDDTAMTNEAIAKATVEMAPTSQATKAVADDDEVAEKTPERDSTQFLPHEHVTYEILGVTRANNVIMYHIYTINSATGDRSMSIPKRYSEFKLLDEQLRAMDIPTAHDLPELPKPSVGTFLRGRRSKKTIERREKAFGDFLHYITKHEELHGCAVFQQFIAN